MLKNEQGSSIEEQKQKIRARYKGVDKGELEFIPAKPRQKLFEEAGVKRVCAYCRVSTDDPKQTSSYELQKNHYEDMIKEHPGWELVGIYADEGISGTSLEHRENCLRMLEDCRKGGIDLIITKSVSRFARNIVDCIAQVRRLAQLNPPVGVFFEAEHIYTLDNTSEMMLAVLSATAQEESRTKSEIMNISVEQRFSRGIFILTDMLGFRRDKDGNLIINEDEADTVRICFYLCLNGYSNNEIADILTALERPRKHGSTQWDGSAVRNILQNEKHCGDVLARKTFTPNYLDHRSKKNRQDRNQYRQRNHHEAIVSREVFLAANQMIEFHKHARGNQPLPTLQVIESGFLQGYILVHLGWAGFSAEQYMQASDSASEKDMEQPFTTDSKKPSGFQIVRTQMFSTARTPAMRISSRTITFTASCIRQFGPAEHVQLFFHPRKHTFAVRPCAKSTPAAMHWCIFRNGKCLPYGKSFAAFSEIVFGIMGWDAGQVYRICGNRCREDDGEIMVFDLAEAESYRKTSEETAQKSYKQRFSARIFPSAWSHSFGPAAERESQRQKEERSLYKNGWGLSQAAASAVKDGDLTADDVESLMYNAEKIMERIGSQNE